jgi:opacity protein-like surface antigen
MSPSRFFHDQDLEDRPLMKRKLFTAALVVLLCAVAAAAQTQQEKDASRAATRERLRQLLATSGPKKGIGLEFKQSEKNPFNFVAVKRDGLTNCDLLEIVISVSDAETVGIHIYPHYKGAYINLDKAKDSYGLGRLLLNMNSTNFLYWGADSTDDVFASYNFTLESGFPDKAIEVVLYSIAPLDEFVGKMRPFVDVGAAP